jgi:hypothetical protein
MYSAVLAKRVEVLGPTHPDTLVAKRNLDVLIEKRANAEAERARVPRVRDPPRIKKDANGRPGAPALPLPALSPVEAEARARVAEAELLAMLELDDANKPNGKAGKAGKP